MREKAIDLGAGEENRTPVCSLEGYRSTTELHPLMACHPKPASLVKPNLGAEWWAGKDLAPLASYRRLEVAARSLPLRTTIVVLVFPHFVRRSLPSNPIYVLEVSK